MQRINLEILERKITFLFFENPKKTYNLKQIKYFVGAKIEERDLLKIIHSISRKNYIKEHGRGKFSFNKNKQYKKGKILRRKKKIVDLDSSVEYKLTKSQKSGLFPNDIVYYLIDKKDRVNVASLKHRELTKYVGVIKKEKGLNILKNTGLDTEIIVKGKCNENDMVTAHITDWKYNLPEGKILKIIGNKQDTNTQIHAILEEYNFQKT